MSAPGHSRPFWYGVRRPLSGCLRTCGAPVADRSRPSRESILEIAPAGHAGAGQCIQRSAGGSARPRSLGGGIDGIKRLARRHEQAIPLRPAEGDVAAHLRQTDPPEQFALRRGLDVISENQLDGSICRGRCRDGERAASHWFSGDTREGFEQ